jgi:O-antigen/teichoic acid export membrane protein
MVKSSGHLVLSNSLYLVVSSTFSRVLKFVLFFLSARYLSPNSFGFFYYTLGVLMMFFSVSDLGLTALFGKSYFKTASQKRFIANFVTLQSLLILLSVALSGIGYFFLESPE